jgi:threonine dehydrogenase-like Zn-dependent dehydrogenase
MAAHSAVLRGAAQVFVVDKEPSRLALAENTARYRSVSPTPTRPR